MNVETEQDPIIKQTPVSFCEKTLILDGKPFKISGNGYKPFADIYNNIGTKCLEKNSKPIVLVKGRQVGISTMFAALELQLMEDNKLPLIVFHLTPILSNAYQYTKNVLNKMIKESGLDIISDSINYKQFRNHRSLRIDSYGLNPDKMRGSSADVLLYDECGKILESTIKIASYLLSPSKYKAKIYAGTANKKETAFHNLWQKSSRQYYYLGCKKCNKLFPLYSDESVRWEDVWIYGHTVRCTHCKSLQDKRDAAERGRWIPSGSVKNENTGFHINQLYSPVFTREDINNQKRFLSEKAWLNEVLGEFV